MYKTDSAPLGQGQATLRMLQLSGMLSMDVPEKLQLSYWGDLIDSFFVPSAVVKLQLWKDNQNAEAKIFEVGTPILPRFFLVTTQSGVKSMSLTLDGAREVVTGPNLVVVEVVSAVWTYKYQNGYTITLRGPLSAQMCFVSPPNGASVQSLAQPHAQLKIAGMSFSSEKFEKFISFDAIHGQLMDPIVKTPRLRQTQAPINGVLTPAKAEDEKWEEPRMLYERATIPAEPVNAFGIPQATMRCLEVST
ncbi:LIM-domain binding protein, partial [Amylostereum chailletii]